MPNRAFAPEVGWKKSNMHTLAKISVVALLVLAQTDTSLVGAAESPPQPAKSLQPPTAKVAPLAEESASAPVIENLREQLAISRAQHKSAVEFQSDVLSTVYWSLGFAAGLALLLVGYNWFTNYRIYQREKDTLKRELSADFAALGLQERRHFDTELAGVRRELQAAIEATSESAAGELKRSRDESEQQLRALMERRIKSTNDDVRRLDLRLSRNSLDINMRAERFSFAVTDAVRLLEDALGTDYEFYAETALRDLGICIAKKGKFSENEKERLLECLKNVPADLREAAAELQQKLPEIVLL